MPYRDNISKKVTSSTICGTTWRATIAVMCADRIPLGQPAPLFLAIAWRLVRDEGEVPGMPDDAKPIKLTFRKATPSAAGEICFDDAGGPAFKGFSADTSQILTIFGKAASGQGDDVHLVVSVEDEEQKPPIALSVGPTERSLAIKAENGVDAAPGLILIDQPTRFKAVVTPDAPGEFRWLGVPADGLDLGPRPQTTAVAEVTARALPAGRQDQRRLCVLWSPAEGPALMAVHGLETGDLERLFAEHRLDPRHLADPAYRARLEGMTPDEVRAFIAAAADPKIRDYLDRLLAFVEPQHALRTAPEGDRENIVFIGGADPQGTVNPFYLAAEAHFTLHPEGDLRTNLHSLREIRDFLAANPPANGRPWGTVSIVTHASSDGTLETPVMPFGNPGSLEEVEAAIANGDLPPLPDSVMDARSTLRIRGCDLGNRQAMLVALSKAFGGDEWARPIVRAPKWAQSYEYSPSGWTPGDPPPTQTDEYLAEEIGIRVLGNVQLSAAQRLARFTADVPDKHVTAAEAAAAVPFPDSFVFTLGFRFFPLPNQANTAAERARHETMLSATASNFSSWTGWNLVSRTPRADGTVLWRYEFQLASGASGTFEIPFDSGPPANDAARRAALVANIGADTVARYQWAFNDVNEVQPDGEVFRTITATGTATVIIVFRPLTEPDPANPGQRRRIRPALTDLDYYGEEVPVRPPEHPLGENVAWEP